MTMADWKVTWPEPDFNDVEAGLRFTDSIAWMPESGGGRRHFTSLGCLLEPVTEPHEATLEPE